MDQDRELRRLIAETLLEANRDYPVPINYNGKLAMFDRHAEILIRELRRAEYVK